MRQKGRNNLPIVESRAEVIEPQNWRSDKKVSKWLGLFCCVCVCEINLRDDSVVQLPGKFASGAARWIIWINWTQNKHQWLFGWDLWADRCVSVTEGVGRRGPAELRISQRLWGCFSQPFVFAEESGLWVGAGPLEEDNRPLRCDPEHSWSQTLDNIWQREMVKTGSGSF